MSFNWGGFAGGLAGGINQGVALGLQIRKIRDQDKIRDIVKQGMAEKQAADAAQKAAGAAKVETGPATPGQAYADPESGAVVTPIASPKLETRDLSTPQVLPNDVSTNDGNAGEAEARANLGKPTMQEAAASGVQQGKFFAGDKQFDTREAATNEATGKILSNDEHFAKVIIPRVQQEYLAQGNIDGAESWGKYAESVKGKKAIGQWAKAWTAPDFDSALKHFGEYYTDNIDDGVDYQGHKIITKEDGTQVGVVTLKDKATGKTQEMELNRDRMLQLGGAYNPQHLFQTEQAADLAARKLKAEQAMEEGKDLRKFRRDLVMEGVKGNFAVEAAGAKAAAQKESALAVQEAKNKGSMERLRTKIESDERYKKATNPEERRAIIGTKLLEDPSFQRLDEAGKRGKIDEMMRVLSSGEKPATAPAAAKPAVPTTGKVWIRNSKTGQMIEVDASDPRVPR